LDLGYSNDGYIEQKFPELRSLIRRKRAEDRRELLELLGRTLRAAQTELPPPTLHDLSQRLGYSSSTVLLSHEPDYSDRIVERYKEFEGQRISKIKAQA
jgi:hypothetical protein